MVTEHVRGEMPKLYRWLALARNLSKTLIHTRSKIHGPLLTGLGQEGIGTGIVWGLNELGIAGNSWKDGDHRTLWAIIPAMGEILGVDLSYELMANHYQRAESPCRGRDGNVHFGLPQYRIGGLDVSHMAAMLGVSLGKAEALRAQEYNGVPECKRPVVVTCIGEGAAQQGIVHETMNWAAASNAELSAGELAAQDAFLDDLARKTRVMRGAPIIFVIHVNQKSIYTGPREEHGNAHLERPSHLARRALGYPGMWGIDVSGDNPIDVADAVKIAARRAQRLEGASLIVAHTYRRTAHNEDQTNTLSPDEKKELEESWADEPLMIMRRYLTQIGICTDAELDTIEQDAMRQMKECSERALASPPASLAEDQKDTATYAPHVCSLPEIAPTSENAQLMRCDETARMVLGGILRTDPRSCFFGEDVAHQSGGVLALWRELVEEFGNQRVCNVPISEEAILGNLAGRAQQGMRPWAEIQFAPFAAEAQAQIDYVIGDNYYQKGRRYPLVLLNHFGIVGDGGSGEYHSACTEAMFFHSQGWKIVFPADAYDLAGLMRAAHEDPGPVVIYMQIYARGKREFRRLVPKEPYMIPLGKAAVKRSGKDITVLAYGACAVQAALNEAVELAKEGIELEVIDLRTIVPFDKETSSASVRKTGRLIIMHEASRKEGVGAYLLEELIGDPTVFEHLRCQPKLLAAKDTPIPSADELEWDRLPFCLEKTDEDIRLRAPLLAEEARKAKKF